MLRLVCDTCGYAWVDPLPPSGEPMCPNDGHRLRAASPGPTGTAGEPSEQDRIILNAAVDEFRHGSLNWTGSERRMLAEIVRLRAAAAGAAPASPAVREAEAVNLLSRLANTDEVTDPVAYWRAKDAAITWLAKRAALAAEGEPAGPTP